MALFWLSNEAWAAIEPHLPKWDFPDGWRGHLAIRLCQQNRWRLDLGRAPLHLARRDPALSGSATTAWVAAHLGSKC